MSVKTFAAPASTQPLMTVVDMVWPDQSNHHGTLFGGAALSILDRMAFIVGSKVLRGSVVTASVGSLNFAAPAPAGCLVECSVVVTRRGRRSVGLDTRLVAEDLLSGQRTPCLSGEFVMVRKADAEGEAQTQGQAQAQVAGAPPVLPAAASELEPKDCPAAALADPASAVVAEIVFPGHANHRGILHGGPAMEWMAKAGFVAATRQVRRSVVMARSERMDFQAPAFVGDVVEVTARVVAVGRRSIQVHTQMWAESPTSGDRRLCTTGRLVFVALE